jgi:hypothetical protein
MIFLSNKTSDYATTCVVVIYTRAAPFHASRVAHKRHEQLGWSETESQLGIAEAGISLRSIPVVHGAARHPRRMKRGSPGVACGKTSGYVTTYFT